MKRRWLSLLQSLPASKSPSRSLLPLVQSRIEFRKKQQSAITASTAPNMARVASSSVDICVRIRRGMLGQSAPNTCNIS
eukprot:3142964-Rhodomonas_salina.2